MASDLVDLTAKLIALDTVSTNSPRGALDLVGERLEAAGLEAAIVAGGSPEAHPNLLAWIGPPEPGGLMLSGHMDVVPFVGQPGWTREPLALGADGDRLFGRGTSDMKGFLAQVVIALEGLDRDRLRRPLVVLFTSDEEVGCQGSARLAPHLARELAPVPQPSLCWIGEPTSYRVFHTHKGIVEFGLEVRGRGGHSSVPEAGVNAIAVAARALAEVGVVQAAYRDEADAGHRALFPEAPYVTFNVGTIEGGTASNMIAESCRVLISYRPLPGADPVQPYERVRERLVALDAWEWGSPERRAEIVLTEPLVVPALRSRRDTPLERVLFDLLDERESGGAPFCTDGGPLASAGIDSLICGPGELEQAHQPDESVSRRALERGPELIAAVIDRLCGPGAA